MKNNRISKSIVSLPIIFILLSFACTLPFSINTPEPNTDNNTIYESEILIWVEVPPGTPEGEDIQLVILDELSGLKYNSTFLDMIKVDNTHYGTVVQVQVGSILKYRYALSGEKALFEHTSEGAPVRYRMYYADGPGEVHDIVSRWENSEIIRETGQIFGSITEKESNNPVENILVLVGGQQAYTSSDGSYEFNDLPSGQHNLVAYSPDGSHKPFKQNVLVAEGSMTTVSIQLQKSNWVEVTFTVNVPEETVPAVPFRLAGNLSQFGNSFADLGGSISGDPELMPIMKEIEPGKYQLLLSLPEGADFRYKYTQGDGYWNAERDTDGELFSRQLIVPIGESEFKITDTVNSWSSQQFAGIWFDLSVPVSLSADDDIFIQFNQEGWMAKVPMWNIQESRWAFQLLGPTGIGELKYRYCVNDSCEGENNGDSGALTERKTPTNFSVSPYLIDEILNWE